MKKNFYSLFKGTKQNALNGVKSLSAFLIVSVLLLAGRVSAQTIYSYTNATNGAANSVAANATGTSISRVNGANAPGSPCATGFSTTNFSSTTTFTTSLAGDEVTVTPSVGFQLNVTGFTAGLRRSNTGPASVRYAYSTDGGTTWTDQGSNQSPSNSGCGTTTTGTWTTGVITSNPLKFRFFGFNASATAGTFQILNFSINGTVTSVGVSVPTVTTNAASSITATGATLNGLVNPNGGSTTVSFNYGLTTSYGSTIVAIQSPIITTTSVTAIPTLTVNTQYHFRATATNTAGTTNGLDASFWTLANVPSAPTVNNATLNSLDVTLNVNGNPAATQFAIQETSTGNYVQASGILGISPVWQTAATWSTITVTGLSSATLYTFKSKARNGANVETAFSATDSESTLSACAAPTGLAVNNVSCSTADISWTSPGGVIDGFEYSVSTSPTTPGTFTTSTSVGLTSLTPNTTYYVQVRTKCSPTSTSLVVGPVSFTTSSGVFTGALAVFDPFGFTAYGPSPFNATSQNANVHTSGITRGAGVGLTGAAALNAMGGNNWDGTATHDLTFAIGPDNGFYLDLDTLTLRYRRSSTGPATGDLQYSTDGVTFTSITTLSFSSTSSSGAFTAPIVLDGISDLQNIQYDDSIIFRILPTGGASTGTFYIFDSHSVSNGGLRIVGKVTPFAASISGGATICSGTSTDITFTGAPANAYLTYTVNGTPFNVTLSGGTAVVPTGALTAGTIVKLTAIAFSSTSSCEELLNDSVIVDVVPAPSITVSPVDSVCGDALDTLRATAVNASSYSWVLYDSGVPVFTYPSTADTLELDGSQDGFSYIVLTVTGNSPCASVNDTIFIKDCSGGLRKGSFDANSSFNASNVSLKVYPNPVTDVLVNIELPAGSGEITEVELFNLQGVKIAGEKSSGNYSMQWNGLEKCEVGSYLLKVKTNDQTFQTLVVKSR